MKTETKQELRNEINRLKTILKNKDGIKNQVIEDDLNLHIKRNSKLVNENYFLKNNNEDLKRKLTEIYKRSESYKSQLIVYKGLYEKILDKLIHDRECER